MDNTKHRLAYLKHPRDDEKIGENWDLCSLDFGHEQYTIVTDHVHASELVLGSSEADVRLWCASGALLTACKAFQRAESLWGVDARAFDEAFIEASQLADKALAFLRMPAPDAGAQEQG